MKLTGLMLGAMLTLSGLPAFAQQAAQAPVPGWAIGKPEGSTLAPHAPRLTATPLEQVPVSAIRLPAGFRAEVYARGMPGARMMTEGEKGTVFVGTRSIGRVYAVSKEQDGSTHTRVIAQELSQPNGVVMIGSSLYVIAANRVLRYDNIEQNLDKVPAPVELTSAFGLPTEKDHGGNHFWKFATLGPDGRIYTNAGAKCNICEFDREQYAILVSFKPDGSDRRIEARGIRNSVGMGFHPVTHDLWATTNARDWAGDDWPQDSLHHIQRRGEDIGFPFCSTGQPDPQYNAGHDCNQFSRPTALLGSHTAALGMRFYTGTMFPEGYRNQIFIARHGSWNRSRLVGFDVVMAKLDAQGNVIGVEEFLSGLRDDTNQKFLDRPTDVHVMRDGSLLVSGEQTGTLYRVTYAQ
jgi:glucose/arabinose dehydrogenase